MWRATSAPSGANSSAARARTVMVGASSGRGVDAMQQALVGRSAQDALRQSRVETPLERERAGERHTATVARPASGTARHPQARARSWPRCRNPTRDRDLPRRLWPRRHIPTGAARGIDMKRCFSNVGGVRIVDVRTVLLTGPCTHDPWLSVFKQTRSAAFVEIETDAGVVGLGETYAGYFFPESVPLVVDYLRPVLLAVDGVDRDDFDLRVVVGPDAHVLPVLGPRRARRRRAGRHRGRPLGPRRQGARPSRPSAARPRVADQPPRVCDGRPLAVADGRPAPQGRVLPRAGVPGRQAELRLPRLRQSRRGAHQRRPGGRRHRGRQGARCSATPSAPRRDFSSTGTWAIAKDRSAGTSRRRAPSCTLSSRSA